MTPACYFHRRGALGRQLGGTRRSKGGAREKMFTRSGRQTVLRRDGRPTVVRSSQCPHTCVQGWVSPTSLRQVARPLARQSCRATYGRPSFAAPITPALVSKLECSRLSPLASSGIGARRSGASAQTVCQTVLPRDRRVAIVSSSSRPRACVPCAAFPTSPIGVQRPRCVVLGCLVRAPGSPKAAGRPGRQARPVPRSADDVAIGVFQRLAHAAGQTVIGVETPELPNGRAPRGEDGARAPKSTGYGQKTASGTGRRADGR